MLVNKMNYYNNTECFDWAPSNLHGISRVVMQIWLGAIIIHFMH